METLIKFKTFVDEITADSSRNYKLEILKKYKGSQEIEYFLNYLFNPFILTGISSKKFEKSLSYYPDDYSNKDIHSVIELLEYVKVHNTGADDVLRTIHSFFDSEVDSELKDFLEKIITKNLQLGVDTKSINKVIPKLIPEFSVQLANKYFEDPSRIEGHDFALTTKIDGCRIIALKRDGYVEFYTRQGQPYIGLVDLQKEMEEFMSDDICLDGELTLLNKGDLDSGDQYKATTKLCRTKDPEKHGLKMLVFDYMPAEDFMNQKCDLPYSERRVYLDEIFNGTGEHEFKYFNLLPILYKGNDTFKITEWLNYNINKGEEGVMINVLNAPYEFKRCWTLQKVKKMHDLDLEIVNYEEGTNSNKGKLGAFIVRYKDGNLVKVGSGYSKEFREEAWKHPQDYIGRIMSVQFFEESQNADGGVSLRFPVFLELRDPNDKNTPDF